MIRAVISQTSAEEAKVLDKQLQALRLSSEFVPTLDQAIKTSLEASSDTQTKQTTILICQGTLAATDLAELTLSGLPWIVWSTQLTLNEACEYGHAGALGCFESTTALCEFLQQSISESPKTKLLGRKRQPPAAVETRLQDSEGGTPAQAPSGLIGECDEMQEVYHRIYKVGPTRSTVLIRGETGTGKELIAKAIHEHSDRANKPFVAVNCAAIPETLIESELFGHEKGAFTGAAGKRIGLIEEAEGGTLFLDEIGELPAEAQARLLRFIQESEVRSVGSNKSRKVDVRLIAATHRDLQAQSKTGEFRPDLYYRINVFRIFLPLLRERGNDIFLIANHLLEKAALKHEKPGLYLTTDAIEAISLHPWEGNVRELENTIERAAIMANGVAIDSHSMEIEVNQDATTSRDPRQTHPAVLLDQDADDVINSMHRHDRGVKLEEPKAGVSLEEYFQQFVIENQAQMNETELAKKLGISRKCLWERRQRFGIPREKSKERPSIRPAKN